MTVQELKRMLQDMPDDYVVWHWNGEWSWQESEEADIKFLPPQDKL